MNGTLEVLLGHIDSSTAVLRELGDFVRDFRAKEIEARGKDRVAALALAQLLDNYYTAAETLFVRVSQFFENSLTAEKWHADLLEKMMIEVPRFRPALLSRGTHDLLRELMRFRHFNRYYLELSYDWAKLEYLLSVVDRLHPALLHEIAQFRAAVEEIAAD